MSCDIDQTCGDAVYDFPCYKIGSTFTSKQFQIVVNGLPPLSAIASVDLKIYRDGFLKETLSSPADITIDAADTFTVNPQALTLNPYTYNYSLWITFADGVIKSWLKGDFPVEA